MRIAMLNLWICRGAVVSGWILMLAGWMVIAAECLLWLRYGTWLRWPLRDLLTACPDLRRYDPNDWMVMHGADRIAGWIGAVPISLALLATGVALAWNGTGALERAEAHIGHRERQVSRT